MTQITELYNKIANNFSFNHRIELQKEIQTTGELGEINSQFATIKTLWANVCPYDAVNNFSRMKNDVEISHTITIRYFDEAKLAKRIIFGSRIFIINNIICPNENKEFLTIYAKEIELNNNEENNTENNNENDNSQDNNG